MAEATEDIAALEKQLSALQSDDSEENRAKLQELKDELQKSKDDLAETERDQYISDQKKLLDELYLEYETILNERLDNIDQLVTDVIAEINGSASNINTTINEAANSVGISLSTTMTEIWKPGVDTATGKISNVITMYGDKFTSAQTTTNNALNSISKNVISMISQLNKIAETNVSAAGVSSAAKPKPAPKPPASNNNNNNNSSSKPKADAYGIAGAIWTIGGSASGWGNDPTRSGKLTKAYGMDFAKQVQSIINNTFATGKWDRKRDYNAYTSYKLLGYKDGKRKLGRDEIAWTQENGSEMIVRPSDGAILTPLAKGDSVLNATATGNIWDMANSPADFIRDNLSANSVGNVHNVNGSSNIYNQTIENVTFDFKNVKNYEEILYALKDDRRFEKLINSMTIDRIAGKSKLAKKKSI